MTLVVIPARNEAARVAATVAAALPLGTVVVVDDGSTDGTAAVAAAAGATVVRHRRNRGKGRALRSGAAAFPDEDPVLFLDADLGATAAEGAKLVAAVRGGADCAIGLLPSVAGAGGHGFVVRLARDGIAKRTGWTPTQPLSGQRCLTRAALAAAQPFAYGFGVETGMTIDLLRKGFTVVEVPTGMAHRVTGRSWRDQWHRARQYRDVWYALRGLRPSRGRW